MSLRALRIINGISQVLVFLGVLIGFGALLNVTGVLDSGLVVSLGPLGLIGAWLVLREVLRVRRGRAQAGQKRMPTIGLGVLTRSHHYVDVISTAETEAILQRLVGDPDGLGRVVRAARCRDCGHEELVLQNAQDELFVINAGVLVAEQRSWFVGLFGQWSRVDPISPLAARTGDGLGDVDS